MKFAEVLSTKIPQSMGTTTSVVIHTILFVGIFSLKFAGYGVDQIMLILTTLVSLEAIYLSLFIQMTVNRHTENLEDIGDDVMDKIKNIDQIGLDLNKLIEDIKVMKKIK